MSVTIWDFHFNILFQARPFQESKAGHLLFANKSCSSFPRKIFLHIIFIAGLLSHVISGIEALQSRKVENWPNPRRNFITMTRVHKLQALVRKAKDFTPKGAARFFKVGKGEYAEHDKFLGASMPTLRKISKESLDLDPADTVALLKSEYNEERCLALIILGDRYHQASDLPTKKSIVDLYMDNLSHVNNWNLVDVSCAKILGTYLLETSADMTVLDTLAVSTNLWERRVAIVSTLSFIRVGQFEPTMSIARKLLFDEEDLIHKATGWMLREMGKKDQSVLRGFLDQHAFEMPPVMLSYSLEKFTPAVRKMYRQLTAPKVKDA